MILWYSGLHHNRSRRQQDSRKTRKNKVRDGFNRLINFVELLQSKVSGKLGPKAGLICQVPRGQKIMPTEVKAPRHASASGHCRLGHGHGHWRQLRPCWWETFAGGKHSLPMKEQERERERYNFSHILVNLLVLVEFYSSFMVEVLCIARILCITRISGILKRRKVK